MVLLIFQNNFTDILSPIPSGACEFIQKYWCLWWCTSIKHFIGFKWWLKSSESVQILKLTTQNGWNCNHSFFSFSFCVLWRLLVANLPHCSQLICNQFTSATFMANVDYFWKLFDPPCFARRNLLISTASLPRHPAYLRVKNVVIFSIISPNDLS